MHSQSRNAALGRIFAGALIISFAPLLVRLSSMEPLAIVFWRLSIGGAVLTTVALATGMATLKGAVPRSLIWVVLATAFFFVVDLGFWHLSIFSIGPGLATLVVNLQAVLLGVAGVVAFGEALRARLPISIALALVGLGLLFGVSWEALSDASRLGLGAALAAAVAYGIYLMFLRHMQSGAAAGEQILRMGLMSLACGSFGGLGALAAGESFVPPDLTALACLLGLGVVCQGIGWLSISRGLPGVEVSVGGLAVMLQPALAMVWEWLLFGREFSVREVAGAALILGAIYLGATGKGRTKAPRPEQTKGAATAVQEP